MKSGLWILLLVIAAGILVGSLLKGRLTEPEGSEDLMALQRSYSEDQPEVMLERLEQFLLDYPESQYRVNAYYLITGVMLHDLGDTSGMIAFAEKTLEQESDPEIRALMYRNLYGATAETRPNDAYLYAVKLRDSGLEVGSAYNDIAYDYALKGKRLGLAATLADKAVEFAESAGDSSAYLDTRGWVYFQARDYAKALSDLEQAVRLAPEASEEVLGHLARAQLKTGRTDEAFETFRTILVMGEYADARDGIEAIMDEKGYTSDQREDFEIGLWDERVARAVQVEPFALAAIGGGKFEFKPEASPVTVINIFSPTCGPCRAELPYMEKIHTDYADKGVKVIIIDAENQEEATRKIMEEVPVTALVLLDDGGLSGKGLDWRWTPTTFVIDPQGRVMFKHIGFSEDVGDVLRREVEALLARRYPM